MRNVIAFGCNSRQLAHRYAYGALACYYEPDTVERIQLTRKL